jgi:hypothetical protein
VKLLKGKLVDILLKTNNPIAEAGNIKTCFPSNLPNRKLSNIVVKTENLDWPPKWRCFLWVPTSARAWTRRPTGCRSPSGRRCWSRSWHRLGQNSENDYSDFIGTCSKLIDAQSLELISFQGAGVLGFARKFRGFPIFVF